MIFRVGLPPLSRFPSQTGMSPQSSPHYVEMLSPLLGLMDILRPPQLAENTVPWEIDKTSNFGAGPF